MKKNNTFELFSKYKTLIMGIATISVIIFHFTDDLRIYNYNYDGIFKMYNYFISSGGVDIFLLMSGLGCYYSYSKNPNYEKFIIKRAKKILIPYFSLAIPVYVFNNLVYLKRSWIYIIKDLLFITFIKNGNTLFWYILFIMICYLIFPYLYNLFKTKKNNYEIEQTLINIFTFITVLGILLTLKADDLFANINIMLLRFPVFAFGAYLGKLAYNKEKIDKKWITFVIIGFLVMPLKSYNKVLFSRYIVGFINIGLIFIFVQLMEFLERKKINLKIIYKMLNWLGKYSLELYISHVVIRSFFNKYNIHTYILKNELLMIALSIILSLIIRLTTNVINEKINKIEKITKIKQKSNY